MVQSIKNYMHDEAFDFLNSVIFSLWATIIINVNLTDVACLKYFGMQVPTPPSRLLSINTFEYN